jgi:PAS domain S-box-containing protein
MATERILVLEEALRESERRYRLLAENVTDVIWIRDMNGRLTYISPSVKLQLGYSVEEAMAYTVEEMLTPASLEVFTKARAEAVALENMGQGGDLWQRPLELEFKRKDGSTVWVETKAASLRDPDGRPVGILGIGRDITEHRRAEEARLREKETEARAQAAEAAKWELGKEIAERKRAEDKVKQHNRRLAALNAIIAAVSSSLDLLEVLEICKNLLIERLNVPGGAIFLYDEADDRLYLKVGWRLPQEILAAFKMIPATAFHNEHVIRQKEAILKPDFREVAPLLALGLDVARPEWQSYLSVPLLAKGKVKGVIDLFSQAPTVFSEDQVALFTALGQQLGVAIENARLYDLVRQNIDKLTILNQIGQAINSTLDLQEMLTIITDQATRLLGVETALVALRDEAGGDLYFAAASGVGADFALSRRLVLGRGIAGWVAQQGQPLLVPYAGEDPHCYPGIDEATGSVARSLLAVPVQVKGRVIGVIETVNKAEGDFNQADLELLSSIALVAGIAVDNARLFKEAQHRAMELTTLNKAGQAMTSTLDLDTVLARAMTEARATLGAEATSVLLCDVTRDELIFAAAAGPGAETLMGTRMPATAGIAGWVMREAQSVLIQDAQNVPGFYNQIDTLTSLTTRSLLAVPIQSKGKVIGVIEAINKAGGLFNEHDLDLLCTLASSAAIAIENAHLYQAEREQRRLVEQSRAQLVQTEKLAATGRLAASLAHEINNPLQSIHNCLQLMLNFQMESDEQREYLQMAAEEVERLISLVTHMLDFAHRPQQEMKPTQLNEVIERVLALAGKYFQHRHVVLQQDLTPVLPLALAVPDELAQVFLNLLLNAVDAMPEGGTLRVSSHLAKDGRLAVAFSDTGCGIPPEHLGRIFEPFFSTKEGSTGLGLSISYNVVERHGGEITVQSQVGKGTTFMVWLPALAGETESVEREA